MSKFDDIQYLIDSPRPDEIFWKARNIAGAQLQAQFDAANQHVVRSSHDGFKWIKAEWTYPSFDHLTFAYKNSVFSVVIELIKGGSSSFSGKQSVRFLEACKAYNLIPCLFTVMVTENPGHANRVGQPAFALVTKRQGWNLTCPETGIQIELAAMAGDERTRMSEWELSNFAIQIVRNNLVKEGFRVTAFCDLPDVNPQIWVLNSKGEKGWVLAKHIRDESELDYKKWIGLEEKSSALQPYDGYFAPVQFYSLNTHSTKELYRGDPMTVNYRGLERIYVS